jgi:hypothetical protein
MTDKYKYFVARYATYEDYYKVFTTANFDIPGTFAHEPGEVIWWGNDLKEGRETAKEANKRRKLEAKNATRERSTKK